MAKKASSGAGNWVTINGARVLIGANGKISKGPAKFIGSTLNDLPSNKKESPKKKAETKKTPTNKGKVSVKDIDSRPVGSSDRRLSLVTNGNTTMITMVKNTAPKPTPKPTPKQDKVKYGSFADTQLKTLKSSGGFNDNKQKALFTLTHMGFTKSHVHTDGKSGSSRNYTVLYDEKGKVVAKISGIH